ncbi:MAG: hypothetical protein AB1Z55_10030 [Acidimicrobiia bacterium]
MSRLVALLLVLALVAAACGGDAGSDGDAAEPTTTAASETTRPSTGDGTGTTEPSGTTEGTEGTEGPAEPPISGFDGPPAPDVAVPVADGDDVLLSQEVLPVYLMFWAEW